MARNGIMAMEREYYSDTIAQFLQTPLDSILGQLVQKSEFPVLQSQIKAWQQEIFILQATLPSFAGTIYFEYSIPRMGLRIDTVLLIKHVIFVLEFKVGQVRFLPQDIDQVWDYALDLKNFHEPSHDQVIVPILIATEAPNAAVNFEMRRRSDNLYDPLCSNIEMLKNLLEKALNLPGDGKIDPQVWATGRYCPTPTILEAAMALYRGHSVEEISRSEAGAINLSRTTDAITDIIERSRKKQCKSICFVTGVPGAGKTLVGLNVATTYTEQSNELYSVFLSGNGPLVSVLREALTRDKFHRLKKQGKKVSKKQIRSEVKGFIQNIHHFRDECLINQSPPVEHVVIFDEAQRAWNLQQTASFMQQKRGIPNFGISEPEYLISCLDRHPDWAVIICLVGSGQEINTGEAGITEWFDSLLRAFPHWHIYLSDRLSGSEFGGEQVYESIARRSNVSYQEDLHLAVSMRSFRAENVSTLVKYLLDLDPQRSSQLFEELKSNYPIVLTRDLSKAKKWIKQQARGSERYGIVVSSQAKRLKPYAIDVSSPVDPVHWFLDGKEDIRSSYYLEDIATEFHIQGLEVDWACIVWDADFRYSPRGWEHWSFTGSRWTLIRREEHKVYQKNAYRVLLTRARQGMVIVVPPGDSEDATRDPGFYNPTYEYLRTIGFQEI